MLKIHKQTIDDKRNDGKMETNSHPQTNYLGSSCPVTVSRRWVDSEHAMAEVDNVEDDDDLWKKLWWLPNMLSRKKEAICSSLLNSVSKSYFVKTNGRLSSSVLSCLIEKKMSDSWSPLDPSTFKVRGHNYLKDKKKECASNQAAYYPIGVDVFLSPHKIDPIARLLELPKVESSGKIRHLLVVNLQVYTFIPPTLFQNEYDGEGMSYVLIFKLSENYEELPLHFKENIRKIIDDQVERVRGFPVDTIAPCRERLKILGRLTNLEDLQLSSAERKLMSAYNEKPVLSRPQHEFFLLAEITVMLVLTQTTTCIRWWNTWLMVANP
ncbi:putative protein ENHANCED DISEASE RESISTANCE 2 [Helianthus annuus]|nr:putative protein ENHANCED DISEASE RESISTANCE 2 [Helianthus annuus]